MRVRKNERKAPALVCLAVAGLAQLACDQTAPSGRQRAELGRALDGARLSQPRAFAEGVLAEDSDAPARLNDLAVGNALRGRRNGEPLDLLNALSNSVRAKERAPDSAEIAFNHALFLEWANLPTLSLEAWRSYLDRFAEPGFRQEAKEHLRRIRARLEASSEPDMIEELARKILAGRFDATTDLPSHDPQRARELGTDHLLGAWGREWLAGERERAGQVLRAARQLGDELAAANGECTLSSAVAAIDATAEAAPSDRRRDHLAAAYADYARGAELFAALQPDQARPHFAQAREGTTPGNPIHLWSQMGLSGIAFYRGNHDEAASGFRQLVAETEGSCLHALAGRAYWGLGLTRLRQGRYLDSLAHYREAKARFRNLREDENFGALCTLIGENLKMLGRRSEAWSHRFLALRSLSRYRGSLRLHNLLWEAASAAGQEIGPEVGLLFQEEGVRTAVRSGDPGLIAEALLWRSKLHAANGDLSRALADLDAAASKNAARAPGQAPEKISVDLDFARGAALRPSDPGRALEPLSRTLAYYRQRELAFDRSQALLEHARALRGVGRPREALGELEEALAFFEEERTGLLDNPSRRSFTESAQAIYDEAIHLRIEELAADPETTFALAEEARTVPFTWTALSPRRRTTEPRGSSRSGAEPSDLHILAALPPDLAVLTHALVADRLYTWLLHRGEVELFARPIDRRRLARRIEDFIQAVRGGSSVQELTAESTALHRLLIPDHVADLPAGTRLYVVPDGFLSGLPFDLLRDPATGRLLIEDRPVGLAPSARSLTGSKSVERPREIPRSVLLIADPAFDRGLFALERLAGAREEIEEVGALYGEGVRLVGAEATRDRLLALLDRHPVLHYSGHAVFNPRQPALSYFPLAPEPGNGERGSLFAHEIARRPLERLRLVVLSACDTLGPTDTRTAGISGLARPFLDAGADAVVGTLWPISDEDAHRLLPNFHRRFLATDNAAVALREAKLAHLHGDDPRGRLPTSWAAFQVVGAVENQ